MARHPDIRLYMGKLFPTATICEITEFLNLLVDTFKNTDKNSFLLRNKHYTINRVNKTLFNVNGYPQVFLINDVVKATHDFVTLNEKMGETVYGDIFVSPELCPDIEMTPREKRSVINAKLFAAVMRRIYNSHRDGLDSQITVNQTVGGELLNIISVGQIEFKEHHLNVRINIIKEGKLSSVGIIPLPIKRSMVQKAGGPDVIVMKQPIVITLAPEKKSFNPFFKVKQFVTGLFA